MFEDQIIIIVNGALLIKYRNAEAEIESESNEERRRSREWTEKNIELKK